MADTDMSNDTLTRIIPQDGWSPTICHKVPIVQTITNIVGDKGPGEIYEGGRIKNFHAKIDWEDQYGGSRVQADIITESSTDYGETWTMNEVQEHAEGSFELDYEGHERDFEVRLIKGEGGEVPFRFDEGISGGMAYVLPDPPEEAKRVEDDHEYAHIYIDGEGKAQAEVFNSEVVEEGGLDDSYIGKYYIFEILGGEELPSLEGKTFYWLERGTDEKLPATVSSSGSSPKLYIRYRWLMNGQEITDASGSLEHAITVTDYPVKLEVDARYADNYGTHEIGDYTFNSAKVTMKSGVVKDVDEDNLTVPSEDIEWADKDGWQSQTWSYTENGRTVTAQVGARITALRDVAIDVEIDPLYSWGNEDGKDYWCLSRETSPLTLAGQYVYRDKTYYLYETPLTEDDIPSNATEGEVEGTYSLYRTGNTGVQYTIVPSARMDDWLYGIEYDFTVKEGVIYLDSKETSVDKLYWDDNHTALLDFSPSTTYIFKEGYTVRKDDLRVTVTRNDGSTPYATLDYWMPSNYPLGRGKQSITVQKGSLSKTIPVTVAYSTKVEVGNVSGNASDSIRIITLTTITEGETEYAYALKVSAPPEGTDEENGYYFVDAEGPFVVKGDCEDYSEENGYTSSEPLDPNGYYLISGNESDLEDSYNYIDEDSSSVGPVTPIGAGGGDFIKSAFYEHNIYTEPTHYKAYYECYDGTEGFDEVSEIDGEWNLLLEPPYKKYNAKDGSDNFLAVYEVTGLTDYDWYDDSWNLAVEYNGGIGRSYIKNGAYAKTNPDGIFGNYDFDLSKLEDDKPYFITSVTDGAWESICTGDLWEAPQYYYHLKERTTAVDLTEEDKGEPLNMVPIGVYICSEYGMNVGTLTLGKKTYTYRVGLEPIDEENYLFIKDFKNKPFNYGLVKCYEPELQVPVELIEAKYEKEGLYAYPVETPTVLISTLYNLYEVRGYALLGSTPSTLLGVVDQDVLKMPAVGITDAEDGYYLIATVPTLNKNIDIKYADGTDVVLKVGEAGGGSEGTNLEGTILLLGQNGDPNIRVARISPPPTSGALNYYGAYMISDSSENAIAGKWVFARQGTSLTGSYEVDDGVLEEESYYIVLTEDGKYEGLPSATYPSTKLYYVGTDGAIIQSAEVQFLGL